MSPTVTETRIQPAVSRFTTSQPTRLRAASSQPIARSELGPFIRRSLGQQDPCRQTRVVFRCLAGPSRALSSAACEPAFTELEALFSEARAIFRSPTRSHGILGEPERQVLGDLLRPFQVRSSIDHAESPASEPYLDRTELPPQAGASLGPAGLL